MVRRVDERTDEVGQAASHDDAIDQLHNLRVFLAVAEAGSITRGAEQLFKAPSAITRSIIDLERALSVSLFERKPRGMLLNSFGKAVLVRAQRIREEILVASNQVLHGDTEPHPLSPSAISSLLFNGRKLQLLTILADLRNLSAAAAHMQMSQAGASMALSRIEAVLGQSLFQRRLEGMVATDFANRLVRQARRVFAELRHMQSDIASLSGTLSGTVVIGTTPLGRTPIFAAAISEANANYPGLRVATIESGFEQLVRSLRSGEIDILIGVLRPEEASHGLKSEKLFLDHFSVMVRSGHPLASAESLDVSDIVRQKWILPRPNALGRPIIETAFAKLGSPPPVPVVETGDLATIRHLLQASDMLVVTSPHQLMFEIETGSVVELPIVLPGVERNVGMIVREGAMLSPAAIKMMDFVRAQVERRGKRPRRSRPQPEAG